MFTQNIILILRVNRIFIVLKALVCWIKISSDDILKYFSSLEQKAHKKRLIVYHWSVVRRPSTFLNISETITPIEGRFYVEHLCLAGTKVYITGSDHMTKMAACPYMVKILYYFFPEP